MIPSSAQFRRLLAALPLLATLHAAPALAQQVVKDQSSIGFTSKQMGVPVDGHFARWDAQLDFSPSQPAAGHVAFTIETASATFGSPETDAEVVKPEWFGVQKFPQATFKSSAIKATGSQAYLVDGQLTIKGKSQAVQVPVKLAPGAAGVTMATGSFPIKRTAFAIGEGEWGDTSLVADEVTVKFKLAVQGMKP